MIEVVAENIYRIEVRMPGNPLKALNSYFIRGDEQDLLIDTGFKLPECREDLKEGLKKLNSHQQRRNILLTHLHSDHSGLADEFVGEYLAGLAYAVRSVRGLAFDSGVPRRVIVDDVVG